MSLEKLLEYIQRTNPEMTEDKLLEELLLSRSTTNSILNTFCNFEKIKS